MPLIIVSGHPSSGKTYRSQQLIESFSYKIAESQNPRHKTLNVVHINDQTLGLNRSVYREAKTEKDARAAEYSAVKRALDRDTIVIADGLNYIKGFRYQLYCEAKALQTPSCVVHVGTPIENCKETNTSLLESPGDGLPTSSYPPDVFSNLISRYEEPNGMTRWDSPLFTVAHSDPHPPCDAIWDALIGSSTTPKTVKPNQATVLKPPSASDYLYLLDKATQETVTAILEWQKDHMGESGGDVRIGNEVLELAAPVTLPQLQRFRRQFISMNRQDALPKERIRNGFIEYLAGNLS
ncbi:MAG: hypothetical protein LQ342_002075 [Letrouitia transgressa]|nr:MAG: hypothetical protein LQ342_002075 [Letrouitia transgressa]